MFVKRLVVSAVAVALLVFLAPAPAAAQGGDRPSYEVYGGFAYTFLDAGTDVGAIGGQGQFTFFVNDWFGIGGEIGYGAADLNLPAITIFPPISIDIDTTQATFLFGPRFRLAGTDRFRVGAQALVGAARASVSLDEFSIALPGRLNFGTVLNLPGGSFSQTAFAMAFGVNFDLQVNDRIAWRVAQPDVLVTTFGGDAQTHFRFSTGIVFGF